MAEQLLNGADVVAIFKQMRCETMPKSMATGCLHHACALDGSLDGPLQAILSNVVATDRARARIFRALGGRKDILPAPVSCGVGILAGQRVRQMNRTIPQGYVGGMQMAGRTQLRLE